MNSINEIKTTILSIVDEFGGTVDIHDVFNHIDMRDDVMTDIEDAMTELVEASTLEKDDIGYVHRPIG